MNKNDYKGVAVFCEQRDGVLQNVALELVSEARQLADTLKEEVIAIVLGENVSDLGKTLVSYGADKVYCVSDPSLKDYLTEPYTQAMNHVLSQVKPHIALFGATTTGRDLAPRLSARLNTGLTADCTILSIVDGEFHMTRPTFGGNLIATILCPEHRPKMATVRPGVMKKAEPNSSRKGDIVEVKVNLDLSKSKVKLVKMVKEEQQHKDITEAPIIVSLGRGVKKQELLKKAETVATTLHGELACSRSLIDIGWMDHSRQIGQTGKTVRPTVYFAFGISGAIQHSSGMEDSEYIIAVNKDKNAPIMGLCDLGLVCDLEPVLNALADELPKLRK